MTLEMQILTEISDRVIEARRAKTPLDVNAVALELSHKFANINDRDVPDIQHLLERTAVAGGAAILSDGRG